MRWFTPVLGFLFAFVGGWAIYGQGIPALGSALVVFGSWILVVDRRHFGELTHPSLRTRITTVVVVLVFWVVALVAPTIGLVVFWPLILSVLVPGQLGLISELLFFGATQMMVLWVLWIGSRTTS